jgi:hypothetical protein
MLGVMDLARRMAHDARQGMGRTVICRPAFDWDDALAHSFVFDPTSLAADMRSSLPRFAWPLRVSWSIEAGFLGQAQGSDEVPLIIWWHDQQARSAAKMSRLSVPLIVRSRLDGT